MSGQQQNPLQGNPLLAQGGMGNINAQQLLSQRLNQSLQNNPQLGQLQGMGGLGGMPQQNLAALAGQGLNPGMNPSLGQGLNPSMNPGMGNLGAQNLGNLAGLNNQALLNQLAGNANQMPNQMPSNLPRVSTPPQASDPSRKRKESAAICSNCAAQGSVCSEMRPCMPCLQRGIHGTCVDVDQNKRREVGPLSHDLSGVSGEEKQGLLNDSYMMYGGQQTGGQPVISNAFGMSMNAPAGFPVGQMAGSSSQPSAQAAPQMMSGQQMPGQLPLPQQLGMGLPGMGGAGDMSVPNRPSMNYTSDEIIIMVEALQTWRPTLDTSDASTLRRFIWLWRAVFSAVTYFSLHNRNVSVDNLVQKLRAIAVGVTFEALDRQRNSETPSEDSFFDKTVQTLVHEHLPMGVIMLHFGPTGVSDDSPPVVNTMSCELFGYSRAEFSNLLADIRGWHRIYHKTLYLDVFRRFIMALATGTDSYVFNAMYVHKSGWIFEGLESRRIWYGKDGVPTYTTIYVQRCDSVTNSSPLIAQEASPSPAQ